MTTHGMSSHQFYSVWWSMHRRCNNLADHNYGGRGITVCDEWNDPKIFISWLEDNGYEKGLNIDRIDNDGGYSPGNCRVVTPAENTRNTRLNRRYLINGEMLFSTDVEARFGIKRATFEHRVNKQRLLPEAALHEQRLQHHLINDTLLTAEEITAKFGIAHRTFRMRIRRGWAAQRAALTPVRG